MEVRNMLCAKYSYKMDIAVKKEEAFQDGMEAGISQGAQQKAEEAAINLLKMKVGTDEQIAQAQGLSLERVLELKKKITVESNSESIV